MQVWWNIQPRVISPGQDIGSGIILVCRGDGVDVVQYITLDQDQSTLDHRNIAFMARDHQSLTSIRAAKLLTGRSDIRATPFHVKDLHEIRADDIELLTTKRYDVIEGTKVDWIGVLTSEFSVRVNPEFILSFFNKEYAPCFSTKVSMEFVC